MLIDHVREDRFPSADHMTRIERSLTPATAGDYLELLLDKVGTENYPSPSMLSRIEKVVAKLPRRRVSQRQLAGAGRKGDDDEE
jgi:hypothetical protein